MERTEHDPPLRVEPLEGPRLAQAYPLALIYWPRLTLDAWLDYLRALPRGSGVRAVFDQSGYIRGVAAYRLCRDLQMGPVLRVEALVALGMSAEDASEMLLHELEHIAEAESCAAIELNSDALGSRHGRAPAGLITAGFRHAQHFQKRIGA